MLTIYELRDLKKQLALKINRLDYTINESFLRGYTSPSAVIALLDSIIYIRKLRLKLRAINLILQDRVRQWI